MSSSGSLKTARGEIGVKILIRRTDVGGRTGAGLNCRAVETKHGLDRGHRELPGEISAIPSTQGSPSEIKGVGPRGDEVRSCLVMLGTPASAKRQGNTRADIRTRVQAPESRQHRSANGSVSLRILQQDTSAETPTTRLNAMTFIRKWSW
jgi:hypothetical protein